MDQKNDTLKVDYLKWFETALSLTKSETLNLNIFFKHYTPRGI